MPDYDFWLRGDPTDVRLRMIEVTHPAWSQTYYIVQNYADGITVQHEDGLFYDYEYVPLTIQLGASNDDLDQSITIGVGDLGDIFPQEIDAIRESSEYAKIKPTVNYREYYLSDLTAPKVSILGLDVVTYDPQEEGTVFECQAKQMNLTASGETFNLNTFKTMRGFT